MADPNAGCEGLLRRFLGLSLLLFFAIVAVAALAIAPAHADDGTRGPVTLVEQSTESRFREAFIFRARARSTAGDIVRVRLIWQSRGTSGNIAEPITDFTPGPEVELEYRWSTRFRTTPPWQIFNYRWEITDSAGNVFRSERFRAEMTDDTREWQRLSDGQVAVYWYGQPESFGSELLAVAQKGYAHVRNATGFTPEDEIRIIMYANQDDFCSFYSRGTCLPWYAGVTFGSLTVQWLMPDDEAFVMRQVVPHELAHAFLHEWMNGQMFSIPRWFNEGQAMNNELEGLDRLIQQARYLAATDGLTRLSVLDQNLGQDDAHRVSNWYAQAGSLVAFLYERWGDESLGAIVDGVRDGLSFGRALEAHTGLPLDAFELAWREWLGATTPPPTLFPTPTLFFPPTPTFAPTPTPRS